MTPLGEQGSALVLRCLPSRSHLLLSLLVARFCALLCYTVRGPYRTQFANGHRRQGSLALWREYHRKDAHWVSCVSHEGDYCVSWDVSSFLCSLLMIRPEVFGKESEVGGDPHLDLYEWGQVPCE